VYFLLETNAAIIKIVFYHKENTVATNICLHIASYLNNVEYIYNTSHHANAFHTELYKIRCFLLSKSAAESPTEKAGTKRDPTEKNLDFFLKITTGALSFIKIER
jgi:hypothetical protein